MGKIKFKLCLKNLGMDTPVPSGMVKLNRIKSNLNDLKKVECKSPASNTYSFIDF